MKKLNKNTPIFRALLFLLLSFLLSTKTVFSQISYSTIGSTYNQDFNSILVTVPANNTVQSTPGLPTGWAWLETGSGANTTYRIHNGGTNTGDFYLYGATGSNERAIGGISSGSVSPQFGASFLNNTSSTITEFTITYTGEQWRDGGSAVSIVNTDTFYYSLNATSLNTGTYTAVNQLSFSAPIHNLVADVVLDGNLPANQSVISHTVTGINWAPGTVLWIKWIDVNDPGNDDGLAIDNFSFTANTSGASLTASPSSLAFGNQNVGTQSASQLVTLSGINLTGAPGNITAIASNPDFEVSFDNISWGPNAIIPYTTSTLAPTSIYVRFSPQSVGSLTGDITFSGAGVSNPPTITLSGTGQNLVAPTQLAITSITPASPLINSSFSVVIEAQDGGNAAQNVLLNTDIVLTVQTGTGTLSGTLTGTIPAGSSSVTLTGLSYNVAETGIVLQASRTAGDILSSGNSAPFTVIGVATHLAFVSLPASATVNTNVSTFTVEARRADNTVDINYTGAITVAISSGSGSIVGTTTVNAVAGVATFTGLQFDQVGSKTLSASASGLTHATGNITIIAAPSVTELILPQYAVNGGTTGNRLQYICRLQLNNLTPNTTYKYFTGASTNPSITTAIAPGNYFVINNASGPAGRIVGHTASKNMGGTLISGNDFVGTNKYAEFTTDATGNYTGWFSFVPTGNAVFADGNQVYVYVQLNNGAGGNAIVQSLRTTNTVTMILPATTARAVAGSSNATAENPIFLYDNTTGSGRPIYGTWAEDDGITTNYLTWYAPNVEAIAGSWGAYIPTTLPNGIRRIEQRNIATGNIEGCTATDADGIWASAGNTVNPSAGTTPILFSTSDAALDALPVGGTASGSLTGTVGVTSTYTLSGHVGAIQWQQATVSGGPYTDISGETAATLNYTPTAVGTVYLRAKLSSISNYCEAYSNELAVVVGAGQATVDVSFIIQGYWDGATGMVPVMTVQSYSGSPAPAADDVDDVTIELRDGAPNYTLVHSYTGRLKTNGTISCTFPAAAIGNSYHIVVNHRNSIQTWSKNPVAIASVTNYSFKTAATQAAGDNLLDISGGGLFAIYNGDLDGDTQITGLDALLLDFDVDAFASGYITTDINGSGDAEGFDYLVLDPNIANAVELKLP